MFGLDEYLIKKDSHYSGFKFRPFIRRKSITVCFEFTDSCRYSGNTQIKEQINKLVGFGALLHHNNSIRLGWRYEPLKDVIKIYRYEYKKGERLPAQLIDTVRIGQIKKIKLNSDRFYWFGKYLFPYFGGKAAAPHKIKIKLSFL